MKKFIYSCLAAVSLAPCTANATLPWLYENPRIGVEFGHRTLKWEEGLGKDHFAESFPQVGLFVEVPVFEHFSVKLGHEETVKRNSSSLYAANSRILGSEPIAADMIYISSTKFSAYYLDIIYNLSLSKTINYTTNAIGIIGFSKGKLKLNQTMVSVFNLNDLDYNNLSTSKKTCFRSGLGIQSLLNNDVGITMTIMHEQTKKLKSTLVTHNDTFKTNAKNSIIYNLSFFYQL